MQFNLLSFSIFYISTIECSSIFSLKFKVLRYGSKFFNLVLSLSFKSFDLVHCALCAVCSSTIKCSIVLSASSDLSRTQTRVFLFQQLAFCRRNINSEAPKLISFVWGTIYSKAQKIISFCPKKYLFWIQKLHWSANQMYSGLGKKLWDVRARTGTWLKHPFPENLQRFLRTYQSKTLTKVKIEKLGRRLKLVPLNKEYVYT